MLDFYAGFWQKGFDFEGRTKRIDYWKVILVNAILGAILSQISNPIYLLFLFACIIPGLAILIRRIRDTGRQWPWVFIGLVPLIGTLWLLWIVLSPSVDAD